MNLELEHHYPKQVHIFNDKCLNTQLAYLCHPQTRQPLVNELVKFLYGSLINSVLAREFPTQKVRQPTRMTDKHPKQLLETEIMDQNQRVVVVNLARAGTLPSQICYDVLNYTLNPEMVRQDHITAARQVDESHRVTGTTFSGSKIGGDVDKAVVLFPDPMGATGGTIAAALNYYKNNIKGKAKKYIGLHLIVTPEYLANVTNDHSDFVVYAARLDRGMSSPEVLKDIPGKNWTKEKGLDDTDYIVPGGGGFGELLNNSYV